MGDRGQRTMAEQFHSRSDHRPQAGQVETLEAISYQRVGAYQSEGLGRSPEKEMGGTPTGTLDPPCWGDPTPCPSSGRQWGTGISWPSRRYPVSGHFGNDALFLNRCSNGTCRSLGKRATLGSSSTASGPRRSLPTSFSCAGTHYVGLLRSLGFWLCRKNIGSSRRSRPWRQDSLLLWYSQPGRPKYHLKKSSGPWKKGLLGCPFFPELIARRKRGHMPQKSWTPSSWGLSATRWAAQPDSMTFSTRHLPLWSIQLPPLSSQHGRPRQSVPHGSGNIRFPWFVQSIPSQAMHGGNLYLHGGPASLSIQALRKVTISSPPSARMAWASSPGWSNPSLVERCIGEKGSSPWALSGSHMAQLPRLHPRLCLSTRNLPGSEKILG